jgi:hypothetical protein
MPNDEGAPMQRLSYLLVTQFPPDNPAAMNDLASTGNQAFEVAFGTG